MKNLIKKFVVVLTVLFVIGIGGQAFANESYAVLRYNLDHLSLTSDNYTDQYAGNGVPGVILVRPFVDEKSD